MNPHYEEMLFGIDIGFGDVKAVVSLIGNKFNIKFPTAIKRQQRTEIKGLENPQDIYVYKNGKYLIGEDVIASQDIIPTRNIDFLKEFTPLLVFKVLCETAKKLNKPIETILQLPKKICLGLPLEYYFNEKDNIKESVRQYMVTLITQERTKPLNISFPNVDMRAQGQGVLTDFMFQNGIYQDQYSKSNLLVIDIGFNTIDVLSVNGGKTSSNGSYMLEGKGVCKITRELAIEIKEKTGHILNEQKIKEVLQTNTLKIKNQPQNLNGSISQVITEYTDLLKREIQSRSESIMNDAEKLIFAGGGVYYIENYIKNQYPVNFVHIPTEPEFSNARGYLKKIEANI
jgi:hypothetical protein